MSARALFAACLVAACGDPSGAPDAAGADASAPCAADRDCDDGLFCNGVERCVADGDADARGCTRLPAPCPAGCDEATARCVAGCSDPDGDGDGHDSTACGGLDCDDADADRFPGNVEVCDASGHDEDCDGTTLGDDVDLDSFIASACCNLQPDGSTRCGPDCDDGNMEINPDATERCNGRDDDCDGALDGPREDEDGDGAAGTCAGLPAAETDCDDADAASYPGAAERCDGVDNDCSAGGGAAPDEDADGDGHAPDDGRCAGGWPADDCDDDRAASVPGAAEICSGADEDCDGAMDEEPAASASCVFPDAVAACTAGACALTGCSGTHLECNASIADGCEVEGASDTDHCGSCAARCLAGAACAASACAPRLLGSRRLGGPDVERIHAFALDAAGNVYAAGDFMRTIDFGGTSHTATGTQRDAFVASYAPDGTLRWVRRFGGSGGDWAHGIALDATGSVYVAGAFQGAVDFGGGTRTSAGADDVFVLALDAAGAHRWTATFGGPGVDHGWDVAVDAAGRVYAVASFGDTVDFGSGPVTASGSDGVLLALAQASGAHDWDAVFNGRAFAVAVDGAGSVYVGGQYFEDDAMVIAGVALPTPGVGTVPSTEGFLARFTAAGAGRWARAFGDDDYDAVVALAGLPDGVLFGGHASGAVTFATSHTAIGGSDAIAGRIGSDGVYLWNVGFGSTEFDAVNAVAAVGSDVYLAGELGGAAILPGGVAHAPVALIDAFVVALAGAGAPRWSVSLGSSGNDYGRALAATPAQLTVGLDYGGALDLGTSVLPFSGVLDAAILRLAP